LGHFPNLIGCELSGSFGSFPQISHDFRPGADFEAAKVRRAVKAAAQRVKATAGCLPGLQLCLEGFLFSHFSD